MEQLCFQANYEHFRQFRLNKGRDTNALGSVLSQTLCHHSAL